MTFGLPYPPDAGVRMRDFYLIREVAKSAEVDLVSLLLSNSPSDPGNLASFCSRVEVFRLPPPSPVRDSLRLSKAVVAGIPVAASPNFLPVAAKRLRSILTENRARIFQIEHSLLAAYGPLATIHGCGTILSLHNVAFQQYARMAETGETAAERGIYRLKSFAMKRAERFYAGRYSRCVVVSDHERKLLEGIAPGTDASVVENGVDCERLQPLTPAVSHDLLFVGMMNYPPNADGAIYFVESILPQIRARIPDVRLTIVGHSPPARVRDLGKIPGVEVTGFVDNLQPYYASASVVVAPLRSGGGTRLKILEAMALSRPVVTTSMGCEGLVVESGKHVMIADKPEMFADAVTNLLTDPASQRRLAGNSRRLVEDRYDWKILGKQLVDIHNQVASQAAA
jgi:glycosyltransferase involved in cell wall biosynthesis